MGWCLECWCVSVVSFHGCGMYAFRDLSVGVIGTPRVLLGLSIVTVLLSYSAIELTH